MYKWLLRIQEGRRWTGCAGAGARLAVASLALLALAVLSSCGDAKNSKNQYEWRQRMTVEVQTPAGIKTGSSVVRVRAKRVKEPNANGDLIETSVFGEATAVAVNREHTLFVLLSGENYPTQELLAWNVFSDLVSKKGTKPDLDGLCDFVSSQETRVLRPEQYPLLVTITIGSGLESLVTVDRNNVYDEFQNQVQRFNWALRWNNDISSLAENRGQFTFSGPTTADLLGTVLSG